MGNAKVKIAAGVAAVLLILGVGGIRIAHPVDGLTNALGSAQSGISVYRTNSTFNVGDKVIFSISPKSKNFLGVVRSFSKSRYQIQIRSKLYSAAPEMVHGSLLAIVPFLGYPLQWMGL
jgi:hypothetical protein